MINPVALILTSVVLGVAGQLLLKAGMSAVGPVSLGQGPAGGAVQKMFFNPRVIGGLGIYGLSMILWLAALTQVQLSFAYPFLSLSYIFIQIASWMFLGERIMPLRLFGIASICIGVIAVANG